MGAEGQLFPIAKAISRASLSLPLFCNIFEDITRAYKHSGFRANKLFASAKALSVVYYKSEYA